MTTASTVRAIAITHLLTLLTVGFAASLVLAADVYLLVFLAVLTAVLFANLARLLGQISPFSYPYNLTIVVAALLAATIAMMSFFGWRIGQQVEESSQELHQSYSQVQGWLADHSAVRTAIDRVPFINELLAREVKGYGGQLDAKTDSKASSASPNPEREVDSDVASGDAMSKTIGSISERVFGIFGKVFTTTFGAAMNIAFVLFVGVFLAIKPHYYRDHVAILFPPAKRPRVIEILNLIGQTLFHWLQGRAATMVITGVGTGVLLWLIGIPLAFTLGVVTGVLTFIPNVGAILALMLSMLVAVSQGSQSVMWVVVAYAGMQFVESNLITPLIQQRQTSVPPPVLLSAQLMMGVTLGFLGVLVATPLVAVGLLLIKETYVVDVLGEGT